MCYWIYANSRSRFFRKIRSGDQRRSVPYCNFFMLTNGWGEDIINVETTFLYGDLEEEIFMKIPEGLNKFLDTEFKADDCLLLLQAMYRLVQVAHQYYKKFIKIMVEKLNFEKCLADTCLLKRKNKKGTLIIAVYVDNILCIGN